MKWLENNIETIQELSKYIHINETEKSMLEDVSQRFPISIPKYYLSLIDKNDPDDPIRKMCVPCAEENLPDGDWDTSGEKDNTMIEGLQHKYSKTCLILSTNLCAMYCRHCFRKRMVGKYEDESATNFLPIIDYIKAHREINNVLISGGDALLNHNKILKKYLDEISKLDHIDFIRLGTRMPVSLPERIYNDPELLEILKYYGKRKTIYISTQFNHPNELTDQAERSVRDLLDSSVIINNQTVLLKGVNDDPDTLASLLSGLTKMRVLPYYVFQCRPVSHVKTTFQRSLKDGFIITQEAKAKCNGYAKRFKYAMSHTAGKIEIIGLNGNDEMVFKYHQAKNPDNIGKVFTRKLEPGQTWLDED